MKSTLLFACVVVVMMSFAVAQVNAAALDSAWIVNIRACNSIGSKGFTYAAGTTATSSNYFRGGEDGEVPPASGAKNLVTIYSVRTDLNGVSHNCVADKREKYSYSNWNKIWDITVVKQTNYVGDIYLRAWNPTGTANDIDNDCLFSIKLYNVTGGVRRLLWIFNPADNGNSSSGIRYNGLLGPSADNQGNALTYNLELVAETPLYLIPEPASIAAMLCGLAGFAGYAIRRRK